MIFGIKEPLFKIAPEHEWLLKAALLTGSPAEEFWRRWSARVRFEDIDWTYQQILPQVYQNLRTRMTDPYFDRLKGICRRTWYENQVLFAELGPVLDTFSRDGVPTLLLKGSALAAHYYRDYSLRPMKDLDLAVTPESVPLAAEILRRLGWKRIPSDTAQ